MTLGPPRAGVLHPTRAQSFGRERRLRQRADFVAIQSGGRKAHGRHVLVVWRASSVSDSAAARRLNTSSSTATSSPTASWRFGFTVSRKVGNAVVRNRVKRRLREVVRREASGLVGVDVVVIARASAASAPFGELRADLLRAFGRIPQGQQPAQGAKGPPRGA